MRVALAMIMQETHSFSPVLTTFAEFENSTLAPLKSGPDVLTYHRGIDSEMGGFIQACEDEGAAMVPIVATYAVPSGPVTAAALAQLEQLLVDGLGAAGDLEEHRADGEVAAQRVLLGRAAHVAEEHAVPLVVPERGDGGERAAVERRGVWRSVRRAGAHCSSPIVGMKSTSTFSAGVPTRRCAFAVSTFLSLLVSERIETIARVADELAGLVAVRHGWWAQ